MKKVLFAAILIISSIVNICAQDPGDYNIKIKVEGFEDSVAYFGYNYGDKKYLQDTTSVSKSGEMVFEGNTRLKKGVYFLYTPNFYMEFLVNEQKFSFETKKDDLYNSMKVSGSRENELFRDFQMVMLGHQAKMKALGAALASAATGEDSSRIYKEVEGLNALNVAKRDSLQKVSEGTYLSSLLRLIKKPAEKTFDTDSLTKDQKREKYNYYKTHFLDGIDCADEGSMRAPVFHSKVLEYLDKVTFQIPDSVIKSVDFVLSKMEPNSETYRFWVVTLFQKYQNSSVMGLDRLFLHIADNYYLNGKADWAEPEMIKELTEELKFHRDNQIGNKALQINLLDSALAPLDLYSVDKDYIVLFFYDPDCGHCRKKTPVLVDVYHEMKDDVEIMAINVGTDLKKWKDFIVEYKMDWINASDPNYKSNFRMQYNVRSTPTIYVLYKNKEIIAKKLSVEDIDGFINDHRAYMERELN